jgi:hypothetical protein
MKLAAALVALLLVASAAHAQEIRPVVDRLAASWSRADAGALAELVSRDGVSVEIGEEKTGPLNARQVAAVLRQQIFDRTESMKAETSMARVVGGTPERGFGELAWTEKPRGTTVPRQSTVFLGLVLEDGAWKITEIRLMR